jgi:hypothetical protein
VPEVDRCDATSKSPPSKHPHVSTGLAPRTYLDKLLAEPFVPFTFSPAGAAVYQLGQFGTAAQSRDRFWVLKKGHWQVDADFNGPVLDEVAPIFNRPANHEF